MSSTSSLGRFSSLFTVLSLLVRRGDRRVLTNSELLGLAGVVFLGALGLFIEGIGVFALMSALVGLRHAPMTLGALLGMPEVGPFRYVPSLALVVGAVGVQRALNPPLMFLTNRYGELVSYRLRTRIISLATALPAVHAGTIPSGELAGVLNEEISRSGRAITAIATVAQLLLGILITATVTFAQDAKTMAAAVLGALPALGLYVSLARRTSTDTGNAVKARIRAQAEATEGLRTLAAIQAVGAGESLRAQLSKNAASVRDCETKIYANMMRLQYLMLFVPLMAAAGALGYAAYSRPGATFAEILFALMPLAGLGLRLAIAVQVVITNAYGVSVMSTSVFPTLRLEQRLMQLTDRVRVEATKIDPEVEGKIPASVVLRKVGYQLPSGPWLFRGLDRTIFRGEPLVIRGPSGTGKSTLASLIAGVNDPSEGGIEYVFESKHTPPSPMLVNYLSQDPAVIAGTFRDNLVLGARTRPDDATLIEALRGARLWDEVEAKGGLDAPIFEGGRNLSGGQLRRLGIARLLTRNRGIWIFDEPTASLDPQNSKLMRDIIDELSKEIVAIVVTHDLDFDLGQEPMELLPAAPEEAPLLMQSQPRESQPIAEGA
ncbi:ABC transporter ATP-binding protein/permease [Pendulispora brunnea]|uniref:ABC transporter ATP-binding protein/permease n=1 Tax=Pendulispora brunnea TaxID=2905690 RepID=A0ABZ2KLV0_9BACT